MMMSEVTKINPREIFRFKQIIFRSTINDVIFSMSNACVGSHDRIGVNFWIPRLVVYILNAIFGFKSP